MKFPKVLIVILLILATAGCQTKEGREDAAKIAGPGSTVVFDYAAGFDNGTLFDTSLEEAARKAGIFEVSRIYHPESVVIGKDPLIPGLIEALTGMTEGETKNVRIPPEKAYGAIVKNATRVVPKNNFDQPEKLKVDGIIFIETTEGARSPVFIKDVNGENVTIDYNHPLAGKFIQFAILVRGVE